MLLFSALLTAQKLWILDTIVAINKVYTYAFVMNSSLSPFKVLPVFFLPELCKRHPSQALSDDEEGGKTING